MAVDLDGADLRAIRDQLPNLSDEEKRDLAIKLLPIARKRSEVRARKAPQNDDELHEWIKRETGIDIPRVPVCIEEGHCAPFDFISDAYFERESALLVMAGREGGKTIGVAVLHYVNSETKDGCESCTFADVVPQAKKAYSYVKAFVYLRSPDGRKSLKPQMEGEPKQSETLWKSGSKVEILVGTKSGVNSPHPQKVHADEIDLMEDEVWDESQPVDLLIPTPQGPRRFGDLQIGDEVFDRCGSPTKIEKINELGARDVYRVELTDGRATECCAEHLWHVGTKSGSGRAWSTIRLEALDGVRRPDPRGGWKYRYSIPQQGIAAYPPRPKPYIDPYVLGVLIGDGWIKGQQVSFRSNDKWIVEEVECRLPDGMKVARSTSDPPIFYITRGEMGKDGTPNPMRVELDRLGLRRGSHDKFLPSEYLEGRVEDRISLLRGLMDTDGSFTKDPYFSTVSEQLAIDVRTLVLSLGGRALMRKKKTSKTCFDNCGYIYEVSTSLPNGINPFSAPSKAQKFRKRRRTLQPSIRSIEFVGRRDCRCIGVDAEEGLYLTSDFIVTHNSRNMSSSGTTADGTRIRAQDIATSTRKSAVGLMQQLIDESEAATARGHKPPWKIYAFCIFEVAQEVPCCRKAPEEERQARLAELGRPVHELCGCDKVVRGEWSEGIPRTLESVCRGRFFRSRGWMDHEDVERKFMQNSQVIWEAQQECRRPMADGLYLPGFTRERLCIRAWQPKPEYGYIWTGTDWGGDAESAVLWIQGPLRLPVQIMGHMLSPVVVPIGAYVVFDMIYKAGIGATKLADEVVAKEIGWRQRFPGFRVHARFADMAGRQQRDDWREHNPPLRTVWYISRDFDPTVKCVQGLVGEAKWFVDITRCSVVADEAESWRQRRGREVEHFNHAMAANRYCLTNVEVIERRRKTASQQADQLPTVVQREPVGAGATGAMPVGSSPSDSESWRVAMGQSSMGGRADSWRP